MTLPDASFLIDGAFDNGELDGVAAHYGLGRLQLRHLPNRRHPPPRPLRHPSDLPPTTTPIPRQLLPSSTPPRPPPRRPARPSTTTASIPSSSPPVSPPIRPRSSPSSRSPAKHQRRAESPPKPWAVCQWSVDRQPGPPPMNPFFKAVGPRFRNLTPHAPLLAPRRPDRPPPALPHRERPP